MPDELLDALRYRFLREPAPALSLQVVAAIGFLVTMLSFFRLLISFR